MDTIFLLLLALLPGFILLYFILFMDRNEREPLGLVIKIMVLGALSLVPTVIIEGIMEALPIYSDDKFLNAVTQSFVQVAWVEELAKLSVVLLFAWKNKNFNEPNDGIVYVGASALGFAMLENIFYVLSHGITVGILRAITAMPSHCFTGVLMGYYVGRAKFSPNKSETRKNILKGFSLAVVLHGIYNALIFTETPAALLIFPMVIGVTVFGIKFMKKSRALSLPQILQAQPAPTVPAYQYDITDTYDIRDTGELYKPHPLPETDTPAPEELLEQVNPKNQLWKVIVSRALLTLSGIFWSFIILGVFAGVEEPGGTAVIDVILGSIIMSFLPIVFGVILEISYRKKKKLFKQLKTPLTPEETLTNHSRRVWKVIISRTLFTVSGLFWVIIILGIVADKEINAFDTLAVLFAAVLATSLPILTGVLLEVSYRKKTVKEKLEPT
ncbi:MAG: PrsW family intramembrane metalloprotease [bacterium]|nr:PrsW family intramembrane metalloprotease [bacterium]